MAGARRSGSHGPEAHIPWLRGAAERVHSLAMEGAGCFVGVAGVGSESSDAGATLVLSELKALRTNLGGKALAEALVQAAERRMMMIARPDALLLRSRSEPPWLPSDLVEAYLAQEHFRLQVLLPRLLQSSPEQPLPGTTGSKFLVITRSSPRLSFLGPQNNVLPPKSHAIVVHECEHETDMRTEIKNRLESPSCELLALIANLAVVEVDQLGHVMRMVDDMHEGRGAVAVIAHPGSRVTGSGTCRSSSVCRGLDYHICGPR